MIDIKISSGFLFLCCAVLLFCGIDTALCSFVAVILHELSHVVCAFLFGGRLSEISFSFLGISMKTSFCGVTSYYCDGACAVAGPAANIIFGIIVALVSKSNIGFILAGTNLLFGIYNMIPVLGLDGGVFVDSVLKLIFPFCVAENIIFAVALIFSVLVTMFGVYLLTVSLNPMIAIFGVLLGIKTIKYRGICSVGG